jgi:hypothetical protein
MVITILVDRLYSPRLYQQFLLITSNIQVPNAEIPAAGKAMPAEGHPRRRFSAFPPSLAPKSRLPSLSDVAAIAAAFKAHGGAYYRRKPEDDRDWDVLQITHFVDR